MYEICYFGDLSIRQEYYFLFSPYLTSKKVKINYDTMGDERLFSVLDNGTLSFKKWKRKRRYLLGNWKHEIVDEHFYHQER